MKRFLLQTFVPGGNLKVSLKCSTIITDLEWSAAV